MYTVQCTSIDGFGISVGISPIEISREFRHFLLSLSCDDVTRLHSFFTDTSGKEIIEAGSETFKRMK